MGFAVNQDEIMSSNLISPTYNERRIQQNLLLFSCYFKITEFLVETKPSCIFKRHIQQIIFIITMIGLSSFSSLCLTKDEIPLCRVLTQPQMSHDHLGFYF